MAVALADRAVRLLNDVLDLVLAGALASLLLDLGLAGAAVQDPRAALEVVASAAALERHRPHVALVGHGGLIPGRNGRCALGDLVVRSTTTRGQCEHVFVSTKGHPYRWFAAALKRRDLAGVKAAAAELDHVTLTDALSIVVLTAERGDRALDRAAARWLARLVIEHPLTALEVLARNPDDARARLADVCAGLRLQGVVGLSRDDNPRPRAER